MDLQERVLTLATDIKTFGENFDAIKLGLHSSLGNHYEIPFAAITIYVAFIFIVPKLVSKPVPGFRLLFGLWNLFLSIFSILGVIFVVPYMLALAHEKGFHHTICSDGSEFGSRGLFGFFLFLFAISKVPELFDTVFLVLLKKDVMFLHWYHHITVLLYSWNGYVTTTAAGAWFCAMNYSVHSVMYFYFFASTLCKNTWWFRTLLAPYSKYITIMQLAQMVGGIVILSSASYWKYYSNTECNCSEENIFWGVIMYASYFVLFAKLYYDTYVAKTRRNAAKKLQAASKKTE